MLPTNTLTGAHNTGRRHLYLETRSEVTNMVNSPLVTG
jgi:hypothetical protein